MNTPKSLVVVVILLASIFLQACGATPSRESTGEFLDSSLITAKVKTKLIDDRITGGFHISVYTFKGVVRLSGTVNSDYEKNYAAEIASSVDGVKSVDNKLLVRVE
jgi:osmotically-inducible protein OsmY